MLKPLAGNELWTVNKHTMAMGTVQTSLGMTVGVDEDRKPGKTDHPFQAIGWSLNFFFFKYNRAPSPCSYGTKTSKSSVECSSTLEQNNVSSSDSFIICVFLENS